MNVKFIQKGDTVDYTPTANATAGDVVVQGELVGIVKTDIPANTLGSLTVTGVFDFPKNTGSGTGIPAGTRVYWDETGKRAVTTAGSNRQIGKSIRVAAEADTTVRVRVSQ